MSRNNVSIVLSLLFTIILGVIGSRFIFGPLSWPTFLSSVLLLFPAYIVLIVCFYMLLNKLIPKKQKIRVETQKSIEKDLNTNIDSYKLQKEYLFVGIYIVAFCLLGLIFLRDALSITFSIIIVTYLLRNPYRVDFVNSDSLIIYRVFQKKKINIHDIIMVSKGALRDKIVLKDDHFYFDHVISNISRLTDAVAENIEKASFPEETSVRCADTIAENTCQISASKEISGVKWKKPNEDVSIIRTVLFFLVVIFMSVFGVFYFKEFVKHL